jgi:hypothetical protein
MPENEINLSSDAWIPAIRGLCSDFYNYLKKCPGGNFLQFRDDIGTIEKPGKIVTEYHRTAIQLKDEIFGQNANQFQMDHHKIAALYIRSFLMHKPFYLEIPKASERNPGTCMFTESPNEYFMLPFLQTIFKAWNNDFDGLLCLDPFYKGNFIKLLYRFGNNIDTLDPLSLANIIYLIEQRYFIRSTI